MSAEGFVSIASSINQKCSFLNSLLLSALFRAAAELVWSYIFSRKYRNFIETLISSSSSLSLILITENPALRFHTTLALVFAHIRPMLPSECLPLDRLSDLRTFSLFPDDVTPLPLSGTLLLCQLTLFFDSSLYFLKLSL